MSDKLVVAASPKAVRVYRTGCVVTFRTSLALVPGDNVCLIDCLANGFAEDSIRVRVPAGIALVAVTFAHDELGEERALRERVMECEARVARVASRMENRASQKQLWLQGARLGDDKSVSLETYESYLDRLPGRLDGIDDELALLEEQRAASERELAEAKTDLHKAQQRLGRGVLRLRLHASSAGEVPCEIVLRSECASWRPVYDVLVESFEQPLRLRLRAEVKQQTGWDWRDVTLSLSTASPAATSGALPKIVPVRLRRHREQPPAPRGAFMGMMPLASAPSRAVMDEDTMVLDDAVPLVEVAPPVAQESELVNSVEYEVPGSWDIAADAPDGTLVEVKTDELSATYTWLAVPSADDAVYMVAVLKDALDTSAIGYEASVYLEGTYCGKVMLEEPATGKSFEVSLGSDTRVLASRRLVRRQASKTLLRGRQSEETIYELAVQSQRAKSVPVIVLDQVPLSEDKDIVVDIGEHGDGRVDAETGEVRWEFALPAGACVTRRLAYTVSHPKDLRVDRERDVAASRWCPECGAMVLGGMRFCQNCGSMV